MSLDLPGRNIQGVNGALSGNPGLSYPRVQGAYPSFSEITLFLVGMPGAFIPTAIVDIRSVDYDDTSSPKFRHMTGPYPVARSRGQYEARGSIEFGLEVHRVIAAKLIQAGLGGFGDVRFDIQVTYANTVDAQLTTDLLQSVRIGGSGQRNTASGGELTTHCPLSIARIQWGKDHYLTAPEIR